MKSVGSEFEFDNYTPCWVIGCVDGSGKIIANIEDTTNVASIHNKPTKLST